MKKQTIYGPPGTGKTTYLLGVLEKELLQVHPNQMAFISFTKQGTYEGTSRAAKRFKLKKEELLYFRTLHSLCFKELGVNRQDMISKNNYRVLSQKTGISFTGYYTEDFSSSNDEYLHIVAMEKHNMPLARKLLRFKSKKKFEYVKFQYNEMKRQLGIIDFDDLLLNYLDLGKPLDIKAAFIDEAQDLTNLQWTAALRLLQNVERIYIAGDDDQAVYEWAGADVNKFLRFSDNNVVLNKSYRLPDSVLRLAKKITRDIRNRKQKAFVSNGTEGEVNIVSQNKVNFSGGELVLARTNSILRKLTVEAVKKGMVFKIKGKSSIDKRILRAITAYDKFVAGELTPRKLNPHMALFKDASVNKIWQSVLKLPAYEIAYYEKVLASSALEKPPIEFETFHSSKGSESEHVVLSVNLSAKVLENFKNNLSAELRCLYVGMTRSKNKLTLLQPESALVYPNKYFK